MKRDSYQQEQLESGLRVLVNEQRTVNEGRADQISGSKAAASMNGLALVVEVSELLQELNWKPWKGPKAVDREAVAMELADVLAFVGNLIIVVQAQTGLNMMEIVEAYRLKTNENVKRAEGAVAAYARAEGLTQLTIDG